MKAFKKKDLEEKDQLMTTQVALDTTLLLCSVEALHYIVLGHKTLHYDCVVEGYWTIFHYIAVQCLGTEHYTMTG